MENAHMLWKKQHTPWRGHTGHGEKAHTGHGTPHTGHEKDREDSNPSQVQNPRLRHRWCTSGPGFHTENCPQAAQPRLPKHLPCIQDHLLPMSNPKFDTENLSALSLAQCSIEGSAARKPSLQSTLPGNRPARCSNLTPLVRHGHYVRHHTTPGQCSPAHYMRAPGFSILAHSMRAPGHSNLGHSKREHRHILQGHHGQQHVPGT